MSGFRARFEEPYPVYRGLRVPVWERDQPVSVRRITDADREEFREFLSLLRTVLERLTKIWRKEGVSDEELLWKIADAIVLMLKSPLILEASPVAPTPLKAHAYVLLMPERLYAGRIAKREIEDPFSFAETIAGLRSEDFEAIRELFDAKTSELVLDLWLKFPADTRPGFNTSSLVAHSLLTSALAWAIERELGRSMAEQARVRLAALLHDLGKVVSPAKHYEASEEIVRKLLAGLVPESELAAVAELVKKHHLVESVLNVADRLAAAADRLSEVVEKLLGDKLSRMERILGVSRDRWEFWIRAYENLELLRREGVVIEDPIKELTQEFLERAAKLRREELVDREEPAPVRVGGRDVWLSLVLIDVGSVQEFIFRSQEIRVVSAASYLVDLVVHAHLLAYLRANGVRVPPEAVIYSGGGNLLMLLPDSTAATVEGLIKNYGELAKGLRIYCVKQPFTSSYVASSERLARAMAARKHEVKLGSLSAQAVGDLCRLCNSAPAAGEVVTPEGRVLACETCGKLYRLGSEFHFKAKWESEVVVAGRRFSPREAFEAEWGEASKRIMEIIAGHDFEELERRIQRRNYAVVKFDGNMMGSFMLEAVSFSDAVERSFRIDLAMKRAYLKALEALYQGVSSVAGSDEAEKALAQVYLGTIYMGGDDGLILAPSWMAPLLAHYIAEEFARQLGLARALSAAVVAGPATMSVWSLIDCADELLRVVKRCGRKLTDAVGQVGALAFYVVEAGSPSGSSVVERLSYLSDRVGEAVLGLSSAEITKRRLERRSDSAQPYLIDVRPGRVPEAWETLFSTVFALGGWSNSQSSRLYQLAFGKAYLASRHESCALEGAEDVRSRLRSLRNASMRALGRVIDSSYWREKLYIYLLRQKSRELGEELAEAYGELAKLVGKTLLEGVGGGHVPIADLIMMIKLTRGGV